MGMLVLVLIVLELLWGRASLVVFAVFFNTGMPSTTGVLQAVFNPENWSFVAVYSAVGGCLRHWCSPPRWCPSHDPDRDTDALIGWGSPACVVLENPDDVVVGCLDHHFAGGRVIVGQAWHWCWWGCCWAMPVGMPTAPLCIACLPRHAAELA